MYCAGLVACLHSQVLAVNFSGNYLLVMNDISFWVLLPIMIHSGFVAKVVNIETFSLYKELKMEIYLECPPDIKDVGNYDCIILEKCIFILIQAARF